MVVGLCGSGWDFDRLHWERGPGGGASVCSQLLGHEGGGECMMEAPCRGEEEGRGA